MATTCSWYSNPSTTKLRRASSPRATAAACAGFRVVLQHQKQQQSDLPSEQSRWEDSYANIAVWIPHVIVQKTEVMF
jgi:hypothetical protein